MPPRCHALNISCAPATPALESASAGLQPFLYISSTPRSSPAGTWALGRPPCHAGRSPEPAAQLLRARPTRASSAFFDCGVGKGWLCQGVVRTSTICGFWLDGCRVRWLLICSSQGLGRGYREAGHCSFRPLRIAWSPWPSISRTSGQRHAIRHTYTEGRRAHANVRDTPVHGTSELSDGR